MSSDEISDPAMGDDISKRHIDLVGYAGAGPSTAVSRIFREPDSTMTLDRSSTAIEKPIKIKEFKGMPGLPGIRLLECPGFGGIDYTTKDIVKDLLFLVRNPDLIIYCWPIDIARIQSDHLEAISAVINAFGDSAARRMVLLFTKGDLLPEQAGKVSMPIAEREQATLRIVRDSLTKIGASLPSGNSMRYVTVTDFDGYPTSDIQLACLDRVIFGSERALASSFLIDLNDVTLPRAFKFLVSTNHVMHIPESNKD